MKLQVEIILTGFNIGFLVCIIVISFLKYLDYKGRDLEISIRTKVKNKNV